MINRALLGVYLTDKKVNEQKNVKENAKKVLRSSGSSSFFFLWNGMIKAVQNVGNLDNAIAIS